jgi:hypothetical protein
MCGVSVDSPCAIICYSDCSVCWVDAPAMSARMVVDLNSDAAKSEHAFKLRESTEVKVCLNGATLKQVAELLNKASPGRRLAYEGAGRTRYRHARRGHQDDRLEGRGGESTIAVRAYGSSSVSQ